MHVYGKGMQGFVGQITLQIGGTKTGSAPCHGPKGGGSNGLERTTSFMTIAKITRGSKINFQGNAHSPSIDEIWKDLFLIP